MIVSVATAHGVYDVDVETGEIDGPEPRAIAPAQTEPPPLPRVVGAAAAGATVVVAVDARPPLLVSHDAGTTWSESGRGLPPIRAVAVAPDEPDTFVAASRNRLHVSHDGGRFWSTLDLELPEIDAIAL
jgi:hypothetical protein